MFEGRLGLIWLSAQMTDNPGYELYVEDKEAITAEYPRNTPSFFIEPG